ncbi:MAG TPA: hypothetical protein DDW36_00330 [Candidatus Magasanikbacteria bacterium]|nr:hypothetical protein [Candidatus Magasanikbacteria bacterium]
MFLKKETEYALRLLGAIEEGCSAEPLSLKTFAKDSGISFLFLQRIAAKLKDAGIIRARKGKVGGYWLSRPRTSIHIIDIIEAIEGPLDSVKGDNAFGKLNRALKLFLKEKTLDELV